ncbi:hypothetical protein [Paludisphaera rhizosphaerae]|uniref:hypothetical protein n=1 Tax=Paludisphaera rhizosphaerae TaxID=2711216 RepID=UPI0013EA31A0|nr:hypothetical protein [Paludisphaera rhizosphaerae]
MTRYRISLGWLMLAIALIGFHLAVVCSSSPPLGLGNLEVGLLPSVTVLAISLMSVSTNGRRGEQGRTFVRGFAASLAVTVCIYLVCCLTTPELVRRSVVYYINEIEPSLYDADLGEVYRLSLEVQGLVLGSPQLLVALAGGTVAMGIARARRNAAVATDRRLAPR